MQHHRKPLLLGDSPLSKWKRILHRLFLMSTLFLNFLISHKAGLSAMSCECLKPPQNVERIIDRWRKRSTVIWHLFAFNNTFTLKRLFLHHLGVFHWTLG